MTLFHLSSKIRFTMAVSMSSSTTKEKVDTLHRKLLFTTISIEYLHDTVDNGLQKQRFVAASRNYFRTEIEDSMEDVVEILTHFERKGHIAIGKYDVLKEIVQFNVKIIEEIEKTEMAMKKLGQPVITETDNGCDEYLIAEVCTTDDEDWQAAAKDIKKINLELQDYHIKLVTSSSSLCKWFSINHKSHLDLLRESNSILRLIKADEKDKRIQSFVELARRSKELLVSNDKKFSKLVKDWRALNKLLYEDSTLIPFLEGKGAKPDGILLSSMFIFLRFDSLQTLNSFWNEYDAGSLNTDVQIALCSEPNEGSAIPDCRMTLSEENYHRYRKYLEIQIEKETRNSIRHNESFTLYAQTPSSEKETDLVDRMSDNEATAIPPQTFVECGECGGNVNISWFCKNCPASFCDACANIHNTKRQYKSHSVVPRTYTVLRLYGPAKIAEQCRIHPEKEISSYCNECDVPCCKSCLAKDHQRHEFSTIEDKYLDAEKSLNDYVRKLDTDIRPTLDRMEEKIRANVKEDDIHVEKVINDINDFRKEVVQNFNRSCDNLIDQVQKISNENKERLREIEKSKEYLESLNREIDEKVQKGNLDLMKYVPPKLESLVPKMKSPQKVVQSFEPVSKVLKVIKDSVGKIHVKDIEKEKDIISKRSLNIQKLNSFKCEIFVTSITKAHNNMTWVMFCGSDTLYLYDDMIKKVRSVTVEGSEGINDMAITRSGEMIVTCTDKKIRRVSVSGKVSTVIDTAPWQCEGVCLTGKEEIVVCMSDQGDKNHVAVYAHDWSSKLREILGEDGKGKHLIIRPFRVVRNGQDLCVVNFEINVVCVDESGDVRWVYDGKQAMLDKSFFPSGICVDKYHNLLVTDINNNCVHYIDREGGLIQVMLTQKQTGLQYYWGIRVDDVSGQVWMGNNLGNVVIAKY